MDATNPVTSDAQKKQDRSRKRKALLAGGVVLGLGAAATLAAWSDDVFADGIFGTGTFELQGDVYDGAGYQDYDSAGDSGSLSFEIAPLNMAPDDTVYAPISIATSTGTTTGAEVTLAGATSEGGNQELFTALRYQVNTIAEGGACDADIFEAGTVWHAESALTVGEDVAFSVGAGQDDPEHLCFAVTLPEADDSDALQGMRTAPVVWQFTGESTPAPAE